MQPVFFRTPKQAQAQLLLAIQRSLTEYQLYLADLETAMVRSDLRRTLKMLGEAVVDESRSPNW